MVLLEQLVATILQTALAPVLCPEAREGGAHPRPLPKGWEVGDYFLGSKTGTVDLLETLPAAGGQRGGKIRDAELLSLAGGSGKTQGKALFAATATLGFVLQSADMLQPRRMVVVVVNPADA